VTAEERIFYESFVGHIELREGIVRRDAFVLERAFFIWNAVGALAAIFAVLRLVELSSEIRELDWVTEHVDADGIACCSRWARLAAHTDR
jgi:hypothetical protein